MDAVHSPSLQWAMLFTAPLCACVYVCMYVCMWGCVTHGRTDFFPWSDLTCTMLSSLFPRNL